jgi:hypothetical protein
MGEQVVAQLVFDQARHPHDGVADEELAHSLHRGQREDQPRHRQHLFAGPACLQFVYGEAQQIRHGKGQHSGDYYHHCADYEVSPVAGKIWNERFQVAQDLYSCCRGLSVLASILAVFRLRKGKETGLAVPLGRHRTIVHVRP